MPLRHALALLGGTALAAPLAFPQVPNLAPFVELHPTWQVRTGAQNRFSWYDPMGRYSIVGVRMILEPGYRAYFAQRLQKVEGSGDPSAVDEAYIEDRGYWRVGKQYLPFGRRLILRESVLAARGDTRLVFDDAPLSIAFCDGGSGRPRGVTGRIGRELGVSFAAGDHFGIQPTSLTAVQNPEDAAGSGRGHSLILGADVSLPVGPNLVTAEWAGFREGKDERDRNRDVSVLEFRTRTRGTDYGIGLSWARDWTAQRDFYRLEAELLGQDRINYLPAIRFEGARFRDFSLSVVVRF
ncbi:MAG: hypothetical protein KIT11_00295 [Fimbriimonadaceae bacterium]|nr:hypothetical protein [Fimbriimonadaceae bacterium]QYK55188.1 MAG: hypothetical protein KF733_09240 [Fimbriimonadaceae bacterium]